MAMRKPKAVEPEAEVDPDDDDVETPAELAYTPADEWQTDDGGQDLVLPSGNTVRIAPPPVLWLGMTGKIPAHLVAIGKHHIADGKPWTPEENEQVLDYLIAESFVEPKATIYTKAPKGVLSIARMSDRDKQAVALTLRLQGVAAAMK